MRRHLILCAASVWVACAGWPQATSRADDDIQPIFPIAVQYHGGRLIESVRVQTLFWGDWWNHTDSQQDDQRAYMNAFFHDLFADGRFISNLAQYTVDGQPIHNGKFETTYTEPAGVNAMTGTLVSDGEIQRLLLSEIDCHNMPAPDENTLYFVFLPANVSIEGGPARRGYHRSFPQSAGKPEVVYAVIKYESDPHQEVEQRNPHLTTSTVSHELAEAITNPANNGWYFINNQEEIADISSNLYTYGWITPDEYWAALEGSTGHRYLVEQVWSNRDNRPVAFH